MKSNIFFASASLFFSFASCAQVSTAPLEGKVIVPADVDPSSLVVQTLGLPASEPFQVSPDHQGYFRFEHAFPVGSSVALLVWDPNGVLNKQIFYAYVSPRNGLYSVYLEKVSFIDNIARSFNTTQSLVSAGLCGQVTGLQTSDLQGSKVSLISSNQRKQFTPSYFNQDNLPDQYQSFLSASGYFCFFNVQSDDSSMDYTLSVDMKNGATRSFHVVLPLGTFSNNLTFDAQTRLYRPVKIFSWNKEDPHGWSLVENASLKTSDDYGHILIAKEKSDLVYFPVGEEFLTLHYGSKENIEDRLFVLQPRSALFNRNILTSIKQYEPGQTYVDSTDPVVLKTLDPSDRDWLGSQTYGANLGSAFVAADCSEWATSCDQLSFSLLSLSGESFGQFELSSSQQSNSQFVSGFFRNLPVGQYQLAVTNPQGQLMWTSIVQSKPNKTQVISFVSSAKLLYHWQEKIKDKTAFAVTYNAKELQTPSAATTQANQLVDAFPMDPDLEKVRTHHSLKEEQLFIQNNSFFQKDPTLLCSRQSGSAPELKTHFMGYVPLVSVFEHHPILTRNRFFLDPFFS